jgi:hypothetical protein
MIKVRKCKRTLSKDSDFNFGYAVFEIPVENLGREV